MAHHRLMSCPAQPPWFCPRPVEAALGGRGALQPLLLHSCSWVCHLETTLARGSNFLYLITFGGSFPQDCFLLLFEPGSDLASSQYFDIKWVHWSSKYSVCFRYCFILARDVISPNMTFSEYRCLFCMCRICSSTSPPSESKSLS